MSAGRVRVYCATSLDGFIAGPEDQLDWLDDTPAEGHGSDPDALDYDAFIADVGALLMGRRTYDVVRGFDMPWPYGDRPVLVATTRPLDDDPPATVRAVRGSIGVLVAEALEAASGQDVYLDGGALIRQAAEAGLIDELVITIAPTALGHGLPLFAGLSDPYPLEILEHHDFHGGMVQIRARPRRRPR